MSRLKKYYQAKTPSYSMSQIREEKIFGLIGQDLIGLKILDVGCATGYFGKKLMKLGAKVVGMDISLSAISKAKKVLTKAVVVDINEEKLPFKNQEFDKIVASELIEHLFNPQSFLNECHRILKKKGELIITTPNLLYWGNRLKFLQGQFKYQKTGVFDEGHVHFFTYQTLIDNLATAGFKVTKENHVFVGNKYLDFLKRKWPGLFAYQLVVKCKKFND